MLTNKMVSGSDVTAALKANWHVLADKSIEIFIRKFKHKTSG